jgi:NAD(P)-dependent dehydrogenase (short-subunit alcohol dehydrogenase family)
MSKLTDKVALVTGGCIGAAIAKRLAGGRSEGGHNIHERRRRGRVGRQSD